MMPGPAPHTSRKGAERIVRLRILATSDLHMHVLPWDYTMARPSDGCGLATLATMIATARGESRNCLLFDNGDFLQGSALGDHLARLPDPEQQPHPLIAAMNLTGYDAVTLGNHEFSHGLPFLTAALGAARFPVVASNLRDANPRNLFGDASPLDGVRPHILLTRDVTDEAGTPRRLKIGILGFLPPQTEKWEHANLQGKVTVDDILTSAQRGIDVLRAAGADLIVALSHSGIEPTPTEHQIVPQIVPLPKSEIENASLPLAALDGIDVVIAGHAHLAFPAASFPAGPDIDPHAGTLHGKPAVMPGANGSHLGLIDLLLEQDATGAWSVLSHRSTLRAASGGASKPDPAIAALMLPAHRDTLTWLAEPVGRTDRPLTTHFALVAPSHALRLVAQAKARYVMDRLRGTPLAHLPVLATSAPFKAGGRGGPNNYTAIPPGTLTMRHVLDIYPHLNTIAALRLSGAELADWLEQAAGLYRTLRAGQQDQPLCRTDVPSFSFDLIDGLEFRIDLSQPPRFDLRGQVLNPQSRRIMDLCWQGRPVKAGDAFILASDSYRAGGAGGFAGAQPDRIVLADPVPVRDILVGHIRTRGTVLPPSSAGWGFVSIPGTSAVFDSSPDARNHLYGLPDIATEPLDLTEDGFLRFRLAL